MAERSPAFQFYPRDFLADANVKKMSVAEVGIYTLLLCSCWLEGSIPDDIEELALMLPRTTTKELQKAWKIVGRCFKPDPEKPGFLIQSRVERERAKQQSRRDQMQFAGIMGVLNQGKTLTKESQAIAIRLGISLPDGRQGKAQAPAGSASLHLPSSFATAVSLSDESNDSSPRLTPREEESLTDQESDDVAGQEANKPPDARAFCSWFYATGIERGVIPKHHVPGISNLPLSQPEILAAVGLLQTYGDRTCRAGADALFSKKQAGIVHKQPSVQYLSSQWDWVAKEVTTPVNGSGAYAHLVKREL